jgi:hypothetical protein
MMFSNVHAPWRFPGVGALTCGYVLTLAACGSAGTTAGDAATRDAASHDARSPVATDAGDGGCPTEPWFASTPEDPFSATVVAMDSLCQHMPCPPDLATLLRQVQPTALELDGGRCGLRLVSGCGVESVYQDFPMPMLSWHYSSATGQLVGASRFDDVIGFSLGACRAAVYQSGRGAPSCSTATTRSLCTRADGGV